MHKRLDALMTVGVCRCVHDLHARQCSCVRPACWARDVHILCRSHIIITIFGGVAAHSSDTPASRALQQGHPSTVTLTIDGQAPVFSHSALGCLTFTWWLWRLQFNGGGRALLKCWGCLSSFLLMQLLLHLHTDWLKLVQLKQATSPVAITYRKKERKGKRTSS